MSEGELSKLVADLGSKDERIRSSSISQFRETKTLQLLIARASAWEISTEVGEAIDALEELCKNPEIRAMLISQMTADYGGRKTDIIAQTLLTSDDPAVFDAIALADEKHSRPGSFHDYVILASARFKGIQKKINIIVAEDERDIRDLICFTLRFAGYSLSEATNGVQAYLYTRIYQPDLVLMDVRMPRMTGYDACSKIKANPDIKHIPVVFLSAKGQESEIQRGLAVGAVEYLTKPWAPDHLTKRIKVILRMSQLGVYEE